MVILIFIFLTPNWWFSGGELPQETGHQSRVAATLVLNPEVIGNEEDKGEIGRRIEALTGRRNVEVLAVRRVLDSEGRPRSFEVDIR